MHASPSNNLLNSHPLHPETLLDSWNPQDTMQSAATSVSTFGRTRVSFYLKGIRESSTRRFEFDVHYLYIGF